MFDLVDSPKSNNNFVGADELGMSRCLVVGRADAEREFFRGAVEADADGVVAHKSSATLQHIQDS